MNLEEVRSKIQISLIYSIICHSSPLTVTERRLWAFGFSVRHGTSVAPHLFPQHQPCQLRPDK